MGGRKQGVDGPWKGHGKEKIYGETRADVCRCVQTRGDVWSTHLGLVEDEVEVGVAQSGDVFRRDMQLLRHLDEGVLRDREDIEAGGRARVVVEHAVDDVEARRHARLHDVHCRPTSDVGREALIGLVELLGQPVLGGRNRPVVPKDLDAHGGRVPKVSSISPLLARRPDASSATKDPPRRPRSPCGGIGGGARPATRVGARRE